MQHDEPTLQLGVVEGSVRLRDVLSDLGFEEVWDGCVTDKWPAYSYPFGNLLLQAVQVTNEYLQPVFQFGGVTSTPNSATRIGFSMPLMVESMEQGTAWIADALDRQGFKPSRSVEWLELGREWKGHLPWVRKMEAYRARPCCVVERDWLRTVARKLREHLKSADDSSPVRLGFDGAILTVHAGGSRMVMAASGRVWPEAYTVRLGDLTGALRRLMQTEVAISVWEGRLQVGSRVMPLQPIERNESAGESGGF